jgi:uncharacterized protein DUF1698
MTEEQLSKLNASLPWKTATLDAKGRKVGHAEGDPYPIPAPLVTSTDERFKLKGRSVVEFGCLEGAHTIALAERAAALLAIDARHDNLMKSAVRCAVYGVFPRFEMLDVEERMPEGADLYFHCGVLYHLQDPVLHLMRIADRASILVLDTHYTRAPDGAYRGVDGKEHAVWTYKERPTGAKAGVRGFSRWLTLAGIRAVLSRRYAKVQVVSDRQERNGPRATIFASHWRGSK